MKYLLIYTFVLICSHNFILSKKNSVKLKAIPLKDFTHYDIAYERKIKPKLYLQARLNYRFSDAICDPIFEGFNIGGEGCEDYDARETGYYLIPEIKYSFNGEEKNKVQWFSSIYIMPGYWKYEDSSWGSDYNTIDTYTVGYGIGIGDKISIYKGLFIEFFLGTRGMSISSDKYRKRANERNFTSLFSGNIRLQPNIEMGFEF